MLAKKSGNSKVLKPLLYRAIFTQSNCILVRIVLKAICNVFNLNLLKSFVFHYFYLMSMLISV